MIVLAIGDVVSSSGCEFLRKRLPALKKQYNADLVVVNGENSADGNGITPYSAQHILDSGADVITGGNHSFRRREIYDTLSSNPFILRPDNFPNSAPGSGYCVVDKGSYLAAVINIQGTVYMDALESPFDCADRLVKRAQDDGCKVIIVDFHAEATSEKKAMGYYLEGKVSAVLGTHTHTPTADAQIIGDKTAYITDLGMTGPYNSVLGIRPEQSISLMKDKLPVRFSAAEGECYLCGAVIDIDKATGVAKSIEPIQIF